MGLVNSTSGESLLAQQTAKLREQHAHSPIGCTSFLCHESLEICRRPNAQQQGWSILRKAVTKLHPVGAGLTRHLGRHVATPARKSGHPVEGRPREPYLPSPHSTERPHCMHAPRSHWSRSHLLATIAPAFNTLPSLSRACLTCQ